MPHSGDEQLDAYLLWRRKTRHLRRWGGPLLAITFAITALALLWQMSQPRARIETSSRRMQVSM
jgi:hypothetical protein